jgi:two-component system sensor histidine kinase/response regulator
MSAEQQQSENPKTIIYVEDDPLQLRVLSKRLGSYGYELTGAEDGLTGIEKARMIKPQVLITDLIMPGMDGAEVCRRIKDDPELRFIYVIILTAKEGNEAKIQGLDSGADDYLMKPFQFEELLARIRVGFRFRALQQDLASLQHQMAITELARTMGHEINNPLAILRGYIELAENYLIKHPDETLQKQLSLIRSASDKIQLVVERLKQLKNPIQTEYAVGMNMLDLWKLDKEDEPPET